MRNELTISTSSGALQLFSSLDAGENSLIINGNTIPAASWTGSGTYTTTIGGVTYTITKAAADTGNLQLIQTGAAAFAFRDINGLKDGTFKDLSCGIDTTAASGTTDGDLYRAINALGWASDVISSALLNVKKLFTKITQEISQLHTDINATAARITTQRVSAAVNSGYVALAYPAGITYISHDLIIQPMYGGGLIGWTATVQLTAAQINIYVRIGNTTPANGSTIDFAAVFIER